MAGRAMKVFVAGGTGAVGRYALPALVKQGHAVAALVRSREKALQVQSQGAVPAQVDLFDATGLAFAVAESDAVVNLLTHIPPVDDMGRREAWAENDRLRTEGSARLVHAALRAGARRFVQESIAYTYPDRGDAWIDERTPLDTAPVTDSVAPAERNARRFAASPGNTAVVLRFGWFYGPGSDQSAALLRAARSNDGPTFGPRDHWIGSLHFEDAAAAVVAALGVPGGAYNVVDEPVRWADFAAALAEAVGGAPWLRRARFVDMGLTMTRSQRVSSRRFREATGWTPTYLSVREGWRAVAAG
jgi:nucleoside-diphosphate-sugar epimerase